MYLEPGRHAGDQDGLLSSTAYSRSFEGFRCLMGQSSHDHSVTRPKTGVPHLASWRARVPTDTDARADGTGNAGGGIPHESRAKAPLYRSSCIRQIHTSAIQIRGWETRTNCQPNPPAGHSHRLVLRSDTAVTHPRLARRVVENESVGRLPEASPCGYGGCESAITAAN